MKVSWLVGGIYHQVCLVFCILAILALVVYGMMVLRPLATENALSQAQADVVSQLSLQAGVLSERLLNVRREMDESTPPYRELLERLQRWPLQAHAYVEQVATRVGLEVAAMEWDRAQPFTLAFESDAQRPWLRTEVLIELKGVWQGHLAFARQLSHCDCLVRIMEETLNADKQTGRRAGVIEALISLVIYHPQDGAYV